MPQTILDRILQTKHKEVEALRGQTDLASLQAAAAAAPPVRNFFAAVTRAGRGPVNLIAEVKKASPSAGVIREDFDPVDAARQYAAAGASALSVLTDEQYFQGRLEYLTAVRAAVDIPVLRKDFIIDPWQVYQSRAAGADAILLIVAALNASMLLDLMILATELRMCTLVEVHDADEMMLVRSMVGFPHKSYGLLGINNRNLATFEVDLNTTMRLAGLAGEEAVLVSESGIKTYADVQRLAAAGVRAVLVGQALMEQGDIARGVARLLGEER
ncbi:MAG: indole-3-glycerol phosphate synthase TrpC [Planctomycetaceae bacterium]|nr:indole-3-glycerol phosphate synthase TrpC [Planctomycetaceae bacterium]